MKKLLIAALAIAGATYAYAQVYTGPPNPVALVCAYNASIPTPVNGKFFYIQCDSNGKIMVQ